MSVYGFEHFAGQKPFRMWIEPQVRADPSLVGADKTFATVTSGLFEISTYDPEVAYQLLARPSDFQQNDMASFIIGQFGENVLTTDGADWSRHRRIVAGAVTERVSSVIWKETHRQAQSLLEVIAASDGQTKNLFDFTKTLAIHVLYAAGMGEQQDFSSTGDDDKTLEPGRHLTHIDTVKMVNENIAGPLALPGPLLRSWPNWLPGSAFVRQLGYAKLEFTQYTLELLKDERSKSAVETLSRNNIMNALMAASDRGNVGSEKTGTEVRKGSALSKEELVGNMYVFIAAGFDTTANTITFCLVF